MSAQLRFVLGFDPGGNKKFGWSLCEAKPHGMERLRTGTLNDADEALQAAKIAVRDVSVSEGIDATVVAAGIDAPMYWSSKGGRTADAAVRKALTGARDQLGMARNTAAGTVQNVNSLRGACLVQGLLLGNYLDEEYGRDHFSIVEAHPKALLDILAMNSDVGQLEAAIDGLDEHERDATVAAFAAWSMWARAEGWRDLHLDEPVPVQPFGIPVSYWMPI